MSEYTLRDIRLTAGLTQQQLAERMESSAVYISQIETGFRRPSDRWLHRLAQALGVDIDRILAALGMERTPEINAAELAAMLAAYPDLADVFEYARLTGQRGLLEHLERQAKLLLAELTAQGVDVGQPGGGVAAANPAAGD